MNIYTLYKTFQTILTGVSSDVEFKPAWFKYVDNKTPDTWASFKINLRDSRGLTDGEQTTNATFLLDVRSNRADGQKFVADIIEEVLNALSVTGHLTSFDCKYTHHVVGVTAQSIGNLITENGVVRQACRIQFFVDSYSKQ